MAHTGYYSDLSSFDNVDQALTQAEYYRNEAAGSADAAQQSAQSAAQSAATVVDLEPELLGYRADAEAAASAAALSADNSLATSQTAVESATSAAASATAAASSASLSTTKAGEASASATTAGSEATVATTKASEAAASATTAGGAATTATTKAGEASASATAAASSASLSTTKADEASTSATTANVKANEASSSASAAAGSAASAESSATAAGISADSVKGAALPLFAVLWWPSRGAIPEGYVAADGQSLSRTTYPDAALGVASGLVPTVADSEWLADNTKRGSYSTGDGSTTFRLPDYNGKSAGSLGAVFQRGDGALSAEIAGVIQRDALQAHTHNYSAPYVGNGPPDDVFGRVNNPTAGVTGGVNNARTSTETRPLNVTGCWVIRLFGAVVNVGSADAAQLASDLANLVNQVDFTIIYPKGGSEASPANAAASTRYPIDNPFPGHSVIPSVEILHEGKWGQIDNMYYFATPTEYSFGASARRLAGGGIDEIVVQTARQAVGVASADGNPWGSTVGVGWPKPFRVVIHKSKGAIA